ncbi:MAG: hypothetical protein NT076_04915, partial [Candidatus Pacearchaeota archaeon]|nr:hypothetical protein [Candidatus Pacearchaeota archaeon]
MVYKKYVYKKGKKFGPYYYESYRVGNKIKKRYLGSDLASETPSPLISNKLAYVFIALGLVALIVLAFYFINFNTGRVVLQISESYSLGEQITGNLNLLLKNGELIPADSIVKIKLNGQEKTISLSSLVTDDKASGNLYAENSQLQGQGEGFGVPGKKTSYPDVDFSLLISKNEELAEIQQPPAGIPIIETPTETTETPATEPTVSETSTSETTEIQTPAQTESLTSAPTTESNPVPETPAPSAVEASSITAQVIKENKNKKEVPGKASKNQNFVYQLKEGETAEIKKNSVSVDGKKVDDNIVSLSISGTSAEIKTDYSEDELGFGQDYLQAETTSLIINLENFNITAEQGTLEVSLVYDNLEIIKASKEINIKLEENETEVVPEIPEENITIITNVTNVGVVEINITNVTLPEINLTNVTLPETNITNITIEQNATNLSIQTIQYSAVIGKPVRWKKVINKPENENLIVELPKETTNVSVKKIEQVDENKDITKEVKISGITGAVIGTNQNNWLRNLFRLTGRVTQEENENASDAVQVEIPENSTNVEIEYYTPAPESSEENITNGKIIFISGPELNYTNILAYTKVPEEWKIKTSNHNQISLSWIEDGNESLKQQWKFQAFDSDNNSLVDYIEWNVPHLSNQIFELNNLSSSSVSSDVKCEGGGAYCHLITDNDLILYYPFDVANISSTEYDWSRSNNNGVYTGIAHWVSSPNGKYGGAYNSSG